MGNGCSCGKTLLFGSLKSKENENGRGAEKIENRNDGKTSTETKTGTFKEAVKNSVDIDPCEKDETVIQKVKEIKVLPPIRNKGNALPRISYTPNRVWGGSVGSFLDTIKRDSIVDEDIITGGKRSGRGISSLTQHKLIKQNSTGELISWEKNVTVLSEVADEPASQIKKAAMEKRRRSLRRNSELVPVSSDE
ncbi:hypothetical protein ABFA07_013321 [Porites harrisoni]